MKKITAFFLAAVLVVCGVLTQPAHAESYGALRSMLSGGEFSLGLGGGVDHDKWGNQSFRHKTVYGRAGFGLGKEWAVGFLAGIKDMDNVTGAAFSSSPVPFLGGTLGGPIYRGKTLAIGPVFQTSYILKPFESGSDKIEDIMKFSGAMIAQMEVDGASLYLGPTYTVSDATRNGSDIELDNPYGGIVGIRWRLPDNWPTDESKTFLDFEVGANEFKLNQADLTLELNVTF